MSSKYDLPVNYDSISIYERKYVREQYIEEQNNLCFWCKCSLDKGPPEKIKLPVNWGLFPNGFLKHPIHLQHDHDTGMTEGAVHAYCNAVMWQYHGR